ncbi:MAG: ArsR/SmtB family transcription factor [Roseibacillus sp.]
MVETDAGYRVRCPSQEPKGRLDIGCRSRWSQALADPTRRVIVECLTTRPCTTGELVERFSTTLVRTAVMKHLDVLEEAGLIHIEREGRVRWNDLEPK